MQHTVDDLIIRLQAMLKKAETVKALQEEFAEVDKTYDKVTCEEILKDIQSMALGIAKDT